MIAAAYGQQVAEAAASYPALRHRECRACDVAWRGEDVVEPGGTLCWVCEQDPAVAVWSLCAAGYRSFGRYG